MKIYELRWIPQDEKEWISGNTLIKAINFVEEPGGEVISRDKVVIIDEE